MAIYLFFIFFVPTTTFGRDETRIEHVMDKFTKMYNSRHKEKVYRLFSELPYAKNKASYPEESLDSMYREYGELQSYKYRGEIIEDGVPESDYVHLFRVVFAKSSKTIGIRVDKDYKITALEFEDNSDHVEQVLGRE